MPVAVEGLCYAEAQSLRASGCQKYPLVRVDESAAVPSVAAGGSNATSSCSAATSWTAAALADFAGGMMWVGRGEESRHSDSGTRHDAEGTWAAGGSWVAHYGIRSL
jgi:hypothetical protein